MIFVTVGAQMPFDRLVAAVDGWAIRRGRTDVFAQIGDSNFPPSRIAWTRFLSPTEFRERIAGASYIVAHAGTGAILSALEAGKPILVMPRRSELRETRNDHQVATARRLSEHGLIAVAFDETELADKLDRLHEIRPPPRIGPCASPELVAAVQAFLDGRHPRPAHNPLDPGSARQARAPCERRNAR